MMEEYVPTQEDGLPSRTHTFASNRFNELRSNSLRIFGGLGVLACGAGVVLTATDQANIGVPWIFIGSFDVAAAWILKTSGNNVDNWGES